MKGIKGRRIEALKEELDELTIYHHQLIAQRNAALVEIHLMRSAYDRETEWINASKDVIAAVGDFFGEKEETPPKPGYVAQHLPPRHYNWLTMSVGSVDDELGECWIVPVRDLEEIRVKIQKVLDAAVGG